ncbi:MAG: conjugative transposon protein TraM [Flavobacteriaceae bacterium]|nr:conjugative transposon protein TraM [Flavobacteriaceae bacterium]MCY4253497.1 conjugative transposon protein TraM [Flavobacteriaceae bacterium]
MKINFKHPKYIAPLLGLPFVIGIPFLFGLGQSEEKNLEEFELQETQGINASVPQPIIDQNEDMDKMDAYLEYFKDLNQESDFLMAIEEDSMVNELIELGYTPNEVRQIYLSNQQMRLRNTSEQENRLVEDSLSFLKLDEMDAELFESLHAIENQNQTHLPPEDELSFQAVNNTSSTETPLEYSEGDMSVTELIRSMNQESERAIIRQHFLMDSLENPEKYASPPLLDSQEKSDHVIIKSDHEKSQTDVFFNTMSLKTNIEKIMAVIDQEVKIVLGSRVKLRLLEEMKVSDIQLPSGQILYGLVTGFQSQRVLLSIKSVVVGRQVIPLSIQVHDQDGLEGLFVPESNFRNIARDIGISATPDLSIETPVRTTTEMVFEAVNQAVQTGTDFLRKSMAKNKAILKYNTVVYLVSNNQSL